VAVRHCRVNAAYGVVFRKPPQHVGWKVEVAANTFLCPAAGLRIEDAGPMRRKDPPTKINVERNYFGGPGPVIHVTGDTTGATFLTSAANLRKRDVPPDVPAPPPPPPKDAPKGTPPPKSPPPLLPTEPTDEAPKSP
jgi:hypothetical protein